MVLFVVLPMVAMPFLVIVLHFVVLVLVLVLVLLAASPDAGAGFGAAAAAICEITTRSQGFGSIHGWCVVAVLV